MSTEPSRPAGPADVSGRPHRHDYATVSADTWAVHGGNRPDRTTGAIRTPIVMANSYLLPDDPATLVDDDPDLLVYTRESGANQLGLQDKLARKDHGEAAAVFATGMAALHATFFTVLNPGDHAIVSNVVYMRTHGLFSIAAPGQAGHRGRPRRYHRPRRGPRRGAPEHPPDPHRGNREPRPEGRRHRRAGPASPTATMRCSASTPPSRRRRCHPARRRRRPGDPLPDEVHQRARRRHGRRCHRQQRTHRPDQARRAARRRRRIAPFNAWLIMRGSVTLPCACNDTARAPRRSPPSWPRTRASPTSPTPACRRPALRRCAGGSSPAATAASSPSPSPGPTRIDCGSSRTCSSSPPPSPSATTRRWSHTSNTRPSAPLAFAPVFREHGLIRIAIGLETAGRPIADLDAALSTTYGAAARSDKPPARRTQEP